MEEDDDALGLDLVEAARGGVAVGVELYLARALLDLELEEILVGESQPGVGVGASVLFVRLSPVLVLPAKTLASLVDGFVLEIVPEVHFAFIECVVNLGWSFSLLILPPAKLRTAVLKLALLVFIDLYM